MALSLNHFTLHLVPPTFFRFWDLLGGGGLSHSGPALASVNSAGVQGQYQMFCDTVLSALFSSTR